MKKVSPQQTSKFFSSSCNFFLHWYGNNDGPQYIWIIEPFEYMHLSPLQIQE